MQLPRAPSSKVLPKCGWQSWETHASFPSIPHSLCSQFVFFSDQILKFLLSQPPTQQLGDLRAPISCIPRQGPSCLTLCSQPCLLNAQVGGQCLGEPSLACHLRVPPFLGLKPQSPTASNPLHQEHPVATMGPVGPWGQLSSFPPQAWQPGYSFP